MNNLFSTKVSCRFTQQYMPDKTDKFGIKFWLALDINSKYIVNGFKLGKDRIRLVFVTLSTYIMLKQVKSYSK